MRWLILVATIVCNIGANTLLKAAMASMEDSGATSILQIWNNHLLWLGILLSGATLVLYTLTLSRFELSVAYPVVTSLALFGVFVASALLFGESMHVTKIAGAALIVVGVMLLFVPRGAVA